MSAPVRSIVSPQQVLATLRRYSRLWLIPMVVVALLATAYGILRPEKWKASQALVVRDETGGSATNRAGRFDTIEAMKTAQETIVQMSRNPGVVAAALSAAGPDGGDRATADWPGESDVEELQGSITVSPPKGSEFGRNEVIFLSVTAPTKERAIVLAAVVCDQLVKQMQSLRQAKAQSLIDELERSVSLARADLESATNRLKTTESKVGGDIDELRALVETTAGTSNLRAASTNLKDKIRDHELNQKSNVESLKLLSEAQQDHQRLLEAPQRLFDQHPALRRLKDGLVDAQLRTAQLAGRLRPDHPELQSAQLAEQEVRVQLNAEIDGVVKNLDADLKVTGAQIESLRKELATIDQRIEKVAELRAEYANQLADVRQTTETLNKAQKGLADVRASQAAALSASVITRLDQPDAGNAPVGPSFPMIVAGGLGGGLMLGLGLVFLVAPLGNLWGRRSSDYAGAGRRSADKQQAPSAASTAALHGRRAGDAPKNGDRRGEQPGRRTGDAAARPPGAGARAPSLSSSTGQAKAAPPRPPARGPVAPNPGEPAKAPSAMKPPEPPKAAPVSPLPKATPAAPKPGDALKNLKS
jgi:uncharacterized protein involved in exopolysaccharide biosynthesis